MRQLNSVGRFSALGHFVTRQVGKVVPPAVKARIITARPTAGSVSQAAWNRGYESGEWDYLAGAQELGRYSVIASLCRHFAPRGRVLDVGCGSGLLAPWLLDAGVSRYLGVDLSEVAIEQARRTHPDRAEFAVADASTFVSAQKFDAIVFNELLYYLEKPEADVLRFSRVLAPGGVIIVSMWHHTDGLRTWDRLRPHFDELDRVQVTHDPSHLKWDVAVLRPRP